MRSAKMTLNDTQDYLRKKAGRDVFKNTGFATSV
jgi:hypothetical protein